QVCGAGEVVVGDGGEEEERRKQCGGDADRQREEQQNQLPLRGEKRDRSERGEDRSAGAEQPVTGDEQAEESVDQPRENSAGGVEGEGFPPAPEHLQRRQEEIEADHVEEEVGGAGVQVLVGDEAPGLLPTEIVDEGEQTPVFQGRAAAAGEGLGQEDHQIDDDQSAGQPRDLGHGKDDRRHAAAFVPVIRSIFPAHDCYVLLVTCYLLLVLV